MPETPAQRFARILLATDGSPNSREACEVVVPIAKSYGSKVTVLSAIPSVSVLASPLEGKYYAVQIEKATEVVGIAASALRKNGVNVTETEIPQGHASTVETIVEYASGGGDRPRRDGNEGARRIQETADRKHRGRRRLSLDLRNFGG